MKLRSDEIDYLAFQLVKRLTEENVIAVKDFDAVQQRLTRVVTDDLSVEDKLNEEVRLLIAKHEGRMRREGVEHHELFKAIKAKLVKERGLIL